MKKVAGILSGTVVAIIVLFGVAGTVAWWNAWVFIVYLMLIGAYTQRRVKKSPGLAEERRTASAKAKQWDLKFVRLINLCSCGFGILVCIGARYWYCRASRLPNRKTAALPVVLFVAAIDIRFRWLPPVSVSVSIAAFIAMAPAALLTYRPLLPGPFSGRGRLPSHLEL